MVKNWGVKVFNHAVWEVSKTLRSDGTLAGGYYSEIEPSLAFIQYFQTDDSITLDDFIVDRDLNQSAIVFFEEAALDVISYFAGAAFYADIKLVATGVSILFLLADSVEIFEVLDEVIKTKNISISGKGVVDIGEQLDIRKNGEIWLWRGIINVTTFDQSRVDASYSNPVRYYFGLGTISYFGNTSLPHWIRTQNEFIPIHQITPNYEGKTDADDSSYPNLLYNYPRGDRFIYDLRPTVFAILKLTAVKLLSDVNSWW